MNPAPLLAQLNDESPLVRTAAIEDLARVEVPDGLANALENTLLARAADSDLDFRERMAAIDALCQRGFRSTDSLQAALELLGSPDAEVAGQALLSFEQI